MAYTVRQCLGTYFRSVKRNIASMIYDHYRLLLMFAVLGAVYCYVLFTIPIDRVIASKYHLGIGWSVVFAVAVYVPFMLVWLVALVGYVRLREYAQSIKGDQDGAAFNYITGGICIITIWLPISALLSALAVFGYRHNASLAPDVMRTMTYLNILALLVAYLLVYRGSQRLLRLIGMTAQAPVAAVLVYVVFAALYTFVVFKDPTRTTATHHVKIAAYYLSDRLILLTVVLPRLISWYIGLQAAYNLYIYRLRAAGKIYREALSGLVVGIVGVITLSALFRSLQAIAMVVSHLNAIILVVGVYVLLAATAWGYVYIARGADRMKLLENL